MSISCLKSKVKKSPLDSLNDLAIDEDVLTDLKNISSFYSNSYLLDGGSRQGEANILISIYRPNNLSGHRARVGGVRGGAR